MILTVYLAGSVATMILMALRAPDVEVRPATIIAVAWPISIVIIILVMLLDAMGYNVDVKSVDKIIGFRKPTGLDTKGFAITLFGKEVQIWKSY